MIGIIDYGVGNLFSLRSSFDAIGAETFVSGDEKELAKADKLILLSDIDGLYTADPHNNPDAKLIHTVHKVDDTIKALAGVSSTKQGTGGMVTKLHAAEVCMACGCAMVIANGAKPANLYAILDGEPIGTMFKEETL